MATSEAIRRTARVANEIPALENGDHLDQATFHARYEAMPEGVRAELIGGVVYMPSPMRMPHATYHSRVNHWLVTYSDATPGTVPGDNGTVILGEDSEPQPDNVLTIVGGQTRLNDKQCLVGPPEWLGEIASSTVSYDLHSKRRDYERYGVQEYAVFIVHQQKVVWFVRENDRFVELQHDSDGILRSRVFPGLWLDPQAFFRLDASRLQQVLQQGLNSAEHQRFVQTLRERGAH